jgi:hypothetical protein
MRNQLTPKKSKLGKFLSRITRNLFSVFDSDRKKAFRKLKDFIAS